LVTEKSLKELAAGSRKFHTRLAEHLRKAGLLDMVAE